MKLRSILLPACVCVLFIPTFARAQAPELYTVTDGAETHWSSFENPHAVKGRGGAENQTAKGHAFETVPPGQSRTLLDTKGAGIIQRIWLTISERTPAVLRSVRIEMYWDDAATPAVSAPIGDFFGLALGRLIPFQNALFSDPEGRSFTSYIPMPYRKAARIVFINDSDASMLLFYDVDFLRMNSLRPDAMYFHAFWSRNAKTDLGKDFEILPEVKGRGRYLGSNLGMISDPKYGDTWWGEGEAKIYLDGDTALPTLNGTGLGRLRGLTAGAWERSRTCIRAAPSRMKSATSGLSIATTFPTRSIFRRVAAWPCRSWAAPACRK